MGTMYQTVIIVRCVGMLANNVLTVSGARNVVVHTIWNQVDVNHVLRDALDAPLMTPVQNVHPIHMFW